MKSMFAIGFAFTALLSMFNSMYVIEHFFFVKYQTNILYFKSILCTYRFDGRVVARLPFTPIPWVQGLSHRNLSGENYTECSFIFLYLLCTMSIRQVRLEIKYFFFNIDGKT